MKQFIVTAELKNNISCSQCDFIRVDDCNSICPEQGVWKIISVGPIDKVVEDKKVCTCHEGKFWKDKIARFCGNCGGFTLTQSIRRTYVCNTHIR